MRFYEIHAKSAINRVPDASQMPFRWTINPYRGCSHACLYCFARPTHKYLDFDAGRDFEREIVVKVNAPEVVRAELRRPSWKGEHVAMGTNTDPYQWVESRYKLMPGIWEALRDARNPCSILTKSPLLLRDIELMKEIAAVTQIHANLSIPTLDAKAWRATEPHTPHPRARLEAVAELNRAGIPTGVLDRAAHARHQRRARAGRAAARGGRGGGRDRHRRDRAAPARRRAQALLRLAARASPRARAAVREALRPRRVRARSASAGGSPALVRREETAWPSRFAARTPGEPDTREDARRAMRRRRCSRASAARAQQTPRSVDASVDACGRTPARARAARDAQRRVRRLTPRVQVRTESQRLSSWPARTPPRSRAPPALRVTAAESSGAMPLIVAPSFSATGATSISPCCARSRAAWPRRRARATSCPVPRGSLTPASSNMPGVADEAGEDRRDADAGAVQVGAQRAGEAAQAELRRGVDRGARRPEPCPTATT